MAALTIWKGNYIAENSTAKFSEAEFIDVEPCDLATPSLLPFSTPSAVQFDFLKS
jgi:hypothetical protein